MYANMCICVEARGKPVVSFTSCATLNENAPYRLTYLNACFVAGGTVQGGIGGVALWELTLRCKKAITVPISSLPLSITASCLVVRYKLSGTAPEPHLPSCLPVPGYGDRGLHYALE